MTLSSWASRPSSFVPVLDTLGLANSLSLSSSDEFTFPFESRIPEPTPFLSRGPLRSLLSLTPCRPVSSTVPGLKPFDKSATRRSAREGRLGLPSPVAATRSITSVACPTVATRLSRSPCATSARKNGHGLLGDTVRSAFSSMSELQSGNDRMVAQPATLDSGLHHRQLQPLDGRGRGRREQHRSLDPSGGAAPGKLPGKRAGGDDRRAGIAPS